MVEDAAAARLPYSESGVQQRVREHFTTQMTALLPNAARPLTLADYTALAHRANMTFQGIFIDDDSHPLANRSPQTIFTEKAIFTHPRSSDKPKPTSYFALHMEMQRQHPTLRVRKKRRVGL